MRKQFYFKKAFVLLSVIVLAMSSKQVNAQVTGSGIFFQAVARDGFSNPAKDRNIIVETSLVQTVANGTVILTERFNATTDASGVFNVSIGEGTRIGGSVANFKGIDWSKGPFFLNVKIAIAPIVNPSNWDYTKDLVDLGTSPFGAVPYALFAASVAGFDTKMNVADTAKMLLPYAKVANLNSLVTNKVNIADSITQYVTPTQLAAKTFDQTPILNSIATKLNIADSISKYVTPAQLAAKTFDSTTIYNQLALKATTTTVNTSLATKLNIADSITKYVTPAQLAAKTFDSTAIYNQLALKANSADVNTSLALKANSADVNTGLGLKENLANKSTDLNVDGTSNTKYPTVKSVKDYVDLQVASSIATIVDASPTVKGKIQLSGDLTGTAALPVIANNVVTTAKIADGNITNAKLAAGIDATKITGDISGKATNVTGTVAILNGGTGATSAAAARTNLGLVVGTDVQAPLSFTTPLVKNTNSISINQATTSVDGYLSATDFTTFNNKIDATQKAANNGVATLGNDGKIPSNQIPAISFQNVSVVNSSSAMTSISGAQVGSMAIRTDNNNNYVLSALPASTLSNWIPLATPIYVSTVNGYAGPNVVLTTNDVSEGANNKYYTDARVRSALSAASPLSFNTATGTFSMSAASASNNGYLTSSDFTTFNNKQNALTAGTDYLAPNGSAIALTNFPTLNQSTTGNAATATKLAATKNINGVPFDGSASINIDADANTLTGSTLASNVTNSSLTGVGTITSGVWSGTTIAIAKGGTGATTATAALTNLGAEPTANKSNDVAADAASTIKFPSVKAIKDYVDLQSANAGVADNSLTSAKINGTIAIIKGGTGASTAADARTNLGLVIGTDVMSANFTTTLTGDVTGSGNGSFATTVNSVGGITAATIAGLPTSVNANTASITSNTNSIATLNTNVSANTASITAETTRATNAENALDTRVTSNTASITANTNSIATLNTNVSANTASITAETTRATNAENALDTRVTSNTTSITANTNSIATLNTNVSANTASITAETTRATNAENALDTRVTSNTTSITANTNSIATLNTNVSANTASITAETTRATNAENALDTRVTSNTASVTANTNSIASLNTNVSANTASITAETTRATNAESALDTRVNSNTTSITANTNSIATLNTTLGTKADLASPVFTGAPTAPTPSTSDNSTKLATTEYVKANLATVSAGTLTGTTLASTITGSSLTSVGTITSGTWSATEIAIAKGGTGATTAAGALTNIGAEASANKSTDITADAASTTKYPSVKTIKDYVDTRVASAGVSDGSVTNVKLANSTTTLGSTTLTLGGTVTSVTGLSALSATNLTGALTGNANTATALATGRAISTTGDVTYTSGNFDGTADVTGVATLAASGVSSGTYGSSTAIPVLTVDTKGRVTSASTVGIIAGVNSLNYTSTTSYAAGGTISGTSLTLAAASSTNPGLISTGAQTIAGAKTFSSDVTATNFLGNATTATTAGNITATSNTSLTSLTNLATVGTITTGTWSATEIAIAKGGTGATTASGARTNLGLGSIATKSTIANADVASGAAIDFSKLNITRADISGLGIQEGLTAGSGISISAGTISVTGLTTSNLASNAAITNAQLANSTTILGSTTMTLGGTVTSVAGLTSVSSTGFTGALTGNASTATKLAATKNINGVAFDGSADITVAADANTLTGTTLASNVVNSSLTSVGTITSGVWSGTAIAIAKGGTGATTKSAAFDALSPMTTSGDIIYGNTNGTGTRLAKGTDGQVLTLASGIPSWAAISAVTTLGTFTTTSYAAGGTINGSTLTLSAADGTKPGLVSTVAQTIAGVKTFSADILTNNDVRVGKGVAGNTTNTVVGKLALGATSTVTNENVFNTAIGISTMQNSTGTGSYNTAVGANSAFNNNSGSHNTYLGYQSGYYTTSGAKNVAIGSGALYGSTTGNYLTGEGNNAIGFEAMKDISTTAADNIAIGLSAGTKLTTGTKNIFIGSLAGKSISTGSSANTTGLNSVLIGYDVRPNANADDNEIVISGWNGTAGTVGLGSNTTLIGSSTTTDARIMGALNLPNSTASTSTTTGALTVGGGAGIAGALNVGGATTITGAATISNTTASSSTTTGALKVGGGVGIVGNVNVGGTLGVTGATTLSSTLSAGATTLASSSITGNETVGGTLGVTGATTLSSTLSAGATTLASSSITGNETVGGTLGVTGATTLSTLTASGNATLTSLTATGAATFSSTVTIPTGAGLNKVLTSDANGGATWKSGYTAISTKTDSYTLTLNDNFIIVGSSTATGKTFTLPTAVGCAGKEFTIKNLSAFSLNITATAGKLVQDNSTTLSTSASVGIEPSNNWIKVISDGTDWIVFRALF